MHQSASSGNELRPSKQTLKPLVHMALFYLIVISICNYIHIQADLQLNQECLLITDVSSSLHTVLPNINYSRFITFHVGH
jgi:hypothetical protein